MAYRKTKYNSEYLSHWKRQIFANVRYNLEDVMNKSEVLEICMELNRGRISAEGAAVQIMDLQTTSNKEYAAQPEASPKSCSRKSQYGIDGGAICSKCGCRNDEHDFA